ncbi:hypothetical protein ACLVWQ_39360 [Streptomyces sp. CWNU-52B]|uniref:hypothetical protein n=1 Tax=unclassified Streptomyces TaxID=2593676 RepID=UPI0039BFE897
MPETGTGTGTGTERVIQDLPDAHLARGSADKFVEPCTVACTAEPGGGRGVVPVGHVGGRTRVWVALGSTVG